MLNEKFFKPVIGRDFEATDVLIAIGSFYLLKGLIYLCVNTYVAFRNFVWAPLYPVNFVEKYGQWAVVTGATDGLGKEYARELARRGLKVVLISRNPEKLQWVADELAADTKSEFVIVAADFTKGKDIYPSIQKALHGLDIGVLVNNVGISRGGYRYFYQMTEDRYRDVLEVNNNAMVAMTHLVLPGMISRRRGAIVNVSSVAATQPLPLLSLYASTKSFITAFTSSLAYENSRKGITVQLVMPFYVRTPLAKLVENKFQGLTSIFYPDAHVYARSAVATIPYARETTGYWSHAIQYLWLSIFWESVRVRMANYWNYNLRQTINHQKKE